MVLEAVGQRGHERDQVGVAQRLPQTVVVVRGEGVQVEAQGAGEQNGGLGTVNLEFAFNGTVKHERFYGSFT